MDINETTTKDVEEYRQARKAYLGLDLETCPGHELATKKDAYDTAAHNLAFQVLYSLDPANAET